MIILAAILAVVWYWLAVTAYKLHLRALANRLPGQRLQIVGETMRTWRWNLALLRRGD